MKNIAEKKKTIYLCWQHHETFLQMSGEASGAQVIALDLKKNYFSTRCISLMIFQYTIEMK